MRYLLIIALLLPFNLIADEITVDTTARGYGKLKFSGTNDDLNKASVDACPNGWDVLSEYSRVDEAGDFRFYRRISCFEGNAVDAAPEEEKIKRGPSFVR